MNLQIFHDFATFFYHLIDTRPKGRAYFRTRAKFKQALYPIEIYG